MHKDGQLVLTPFLFASVTQASVHPLVKTSVEQVLGCRIRAPLVDGFPLVALGLVTASKGG